MQDGAEKKGHGAPDLQLCRPVTNMTADSQSCIHFLQVGQSGIERGRRLGRPGNVGTLIVPLIVGGNWQDVLLICIYY
jgi:hypothetical protein